MTEYGEDSGRVVVDMNRLHKSIESVDGRKLSAKLIMRYLNECQSSADEHVKHGEWMRIYMCSACGKKWDFDGDGPSPYCPMCGAKMDEEGADDAE